MKFKQKKKNVHLQYVIAGTPCNMNIYLHTIRQIISATNLKLNSVALVRKQTIPTERPPFVGEVSANFCG
jgi:hypothetical protein